MSHAVMLRAYGGPEALSWEPESVADPAEGEIAVRHTAIGVNFIDIYQRTGLYPIALPACLGREAAGVVEAVGKRVRGFKVGDRVLYLVGRRRFLSRAAQRAGRSRFQVTGCRFPTRRPPRCC